MSVKKLFEQHTPEELVESFVFPIKLTVKQQHDADKQLAEHRAKRRAEMTVTEITEIKAQIKQIAELWDK